MKTREWMTVALLSLTVPAAAHEGGVDARGVVVTASADRISVRVSDGKELVFALTPQTRVVVGSKSAKVADLVPGQRTVVHGRRAGDRLEAVSIRAATPQGLARPK